MCGRLEVDAVGYRVRRNVIGVESEKVEQIVRRSFDK
jgi:hypothetical protein